MDPLLDIVMLESHHAELQALLHREDGTEAAAYMLFGLADIDADPWTLQPRIRLVSHQVVPISSNEVVSSSPKHVTWSTQGFMQLLGIAREHGLVPALVHTHPGAAAFFSDQDNRNEAELARTASHKGVRGLGSIVLGQHGAMTARLWTPKMAYLTATSISVIGSRINIRRSVRPAMETEFLARQAALFGQDFNGMVRTLRVGVVGCGGTGSAVASLLARLGVGYLALVDKDTIDTTNLNRVHGARTTDVAAQMPKVEILAREIRAWGLGNHVVTCEKWVSDPGTRNILRACDVIFGCTDDNQGRIILNRLSHFYGIPVIDIGLRMRSAKRATEYEMTGRVTTVTPGHPCLMCLGVVNMQRAAAEALKRSDPIEFARRKAEAYVDGGSDPAPAVVTFTTATACAAVDELIQGLTAFRTSLGMAPHRIRRFDRCEERSQTCSPVRTCPVCGNQKNWGRADVSPFLGIIG